MLPSTGNGQRRARSNIAVESKTRLSQASGIDRCRRKRLELVDFLLEARNCSKAYVSVSRRVSRGTIGFAPYFAHRRLARPV